MKIERIEQGNYVEVPEEAGDLIAHELNMFLDSSGIDEADDLHQVSGVRILFNKDLLDTNEKTPHSVPLALSYSILKHGENGEYQSRIEREGHYILVTMHEDGSLLSLQSNIETSNPEFLVKWLRETYHTIFRAYDDPTVVPELETLRYWSKKDAD